MDFKVASSIYRKPWLIESQAGLVYLDLLEQIKAGTAKFEKPEYPQLQLFASFATVAIAPSDVWSKENHPGYDGKSLAIMMISGPIMKEDFCGYFGTESMRSELKRINAAESIKDVIFLFDCPGGSVDGTETFANDIKASPKETWGVSYGQVCSGGYWLFSSCKNKVATSKTDIIGSIGTMLSFYDRTQYLEENGIILREFYADASKDKNKMFREAKEGKGRLLIEQLLNPTNDIFLEAVKANTGDKLNEKETLTGKTFLTDDAIKLGLVDSYSPLDTTIENLLNKNTSTKMKIKSTFKNIMSLLGITASAEEVELTQEQLTKIDAALPELAQAKAKVTELEAAAASDKETITSITAERDAAKVSLIASQEEVNTLKAEVERLGNMDAGKFSDPLSTSDKRGQEVGASDMDFQKNLLAKAQ